MEPGRSEETQARTTAEAAQAHEKTEARWAFLKSVLKATSNWHRKTEGRGTEDRETEDRVPGEMWHSLMPRLWVNAPYLRCLCHTCNGKHIGGKAQIAGKLIGLFRNRLKGPIHDDLQLLGDLFHTPEEALQVLHPFKVADGDTTGIGQDIRNDHDALFKENPVGIRRSWAIRRF